MTVPRSCILPLPDWVLEKNSGINPSAYTGALCSGSTALKAVKAAKVHYGDVIIVSGVLGGIGHLVGQVLRMVFGAKVIGVDLPSKCAQQQAGSTSISYDYLVASPVLEDSDSWIKFQAALNYACASMRGVRKGVKGADAVIATASSGAAFHRLDTYIRDGGSIVCVGFVQDVLFYWKVLTCFPQLSS